MTTTPDTVVVPVEPRDLDALRYVLNFSSEATQIRTIMRTFTLPGRETTAERLERLYAALKAARPAATPVENNFNRDCKSCGAFKPDRNAACNFCGSVSSAATPGGEREDSAFKIASDLHAAYEQLIYGLPKYLEAENLTDEENMIREAYITLDVTAHRLAALSRPAPVAGEAVAPREAIWKVVHEVWQLLDDAETDAAGITTPDQARWQAVSDAMDELEALVPDSAGPFWGGYPVNYFWPRATPTPEPAAARGGEELRAIIDTATDAALPPACDTTGNGTKERAAIQVEIASRILSALSAKGGS